MVNFMCLCLLLPVLLLFGCGKTPEEKVLSEQMNEFIQAEINQKIGEIVSINSGLNIYRNGSGGLFIFNDGFCNYEIIGEGQCEFFRLYDAYEIFYTPVVDKCVVSSTKKRDSFLGVIKYELNVKSREFHEVKGCTLRIVIPPEERSDQKSRERFAEQVKDKYFALLPTREFDYKNIVSRKDNYVYERAVGNIRCKYNTGDACWYLRKQTSVVVPQLKEADFLKSSYSSSYLHSKMMSAGFVNRNGVFYLDSQVKEAEIIESGLYRYHNGRYITDADYEQVISVEKIYNMFEQNPSWENTCSLVFALRNHSRSKADGYDNICTKITNNVKRLIWDWQRENDFPALKTAFQNVSSRSEWNFVDKNSIIAILNDALAVVGKNYYLYFYGLEKKLKSIGPNNWCDIKKFQELKEYYICNSNVPYCIALNRYIFLRTYSLTDRKILCANIPSEHLSGLTDDLLEHCSLCAGKGKFVCNTCNDTKVCQTCNGAGEYSVPGPTGMVFNKCSKYCQACPKDPSCPDCKGIGKRPNESKLNKKIFAEYKKAMILVSEQRKNFDQYVK